MGGVLSECVLLTWTQPQEAHGETEKPSFLVHVWMPTACAENVRHSFIFSPLPDVYILNSGSPEPAPIEIS